MLLAIFILNSLFGIQAAAYSVTGNRNNLTQDRISILQIITQKKPWHIFATASGQFCTVADEKYHFMLCQIKLMQCVQKVFQHIQKCKDSPSMRTVGFPSDHRNFTQCSPSNYHRKQHLFKPYGLECVEVYYPYLTVPLMRFDQSKKMSQNGKDIMYIFDVKPVFGLNLTFLIFSLSGLCELSKHDLCKAQNELLFIHQATDLLNFVFCKTRSQWSVFLKNTVIIMFKTCGHLCEYCFKKNSSLEYSYQVITAQVFQTHSDNSHQVLSRAGKIQFSNISYRILERVCLYEQHYFWMERNLNIQLLYCQWTIPNHWLILSLKPPWIGYFNLGINLKFSTFIAIFWFSKMHTLITKLLWSFCSHQYCKRQAIPIKVAGTMLQSQRCLINFLESFTKSHYFSRPAKPHLLKWMSVILNTLAPTPVSMVEWSSLMAQRKKKYGQFVVKFPSWQQKRLTLQHQTPVKLLSFSLLVDCWTFYSLWVFQDAEVFLSIVAARRHTHQSIPQPSRLHKCLLV